ncbi:HutD family protein [Sulfitobacter aestuarii]|uniref:HutD family protein n=1 Tax=Sulfitobacter aestuarii TaxID=2161676 RepID=A0ABW5TZ23_9RHOB
MRIIRMSELVEIPWKNGGGITRNIAADMQGDRVSWRLSMADVSVEGPFSEFAGLTRVLTVIEGTGMVLETPEGALAADYAQPVTFDGATPVNARLTAGPLRDFNLMYDTQGWQGEVTVLHGPGERESAGADLLVLHCIAGQVGLPGGETLGKGDTAILEDAPTQARLDQGDIMLRIALQRRGQTEASNSAMAPR